MADQQASTGNGAPDLLGKVIVVTGANSGIGYEAALQFARRHARVVLACRSVEKACAASDQIIGSSPGAEVEVMELDLSNLAAVRSFAGEFHRRHRALHVLCNNAGVMALPYRRTADGFEMQFGTNHLGHFALTGLLLDVLLATENARVVTVSSGAHRMTTIRFDDLQWEHGYRKWLAYGQSKLANLLFTFELQRRIEKTGAKLMSVACHPGLGPQMTGSSMMGSMMEIGNLLFSQSAAMRAMPTVYAATSATVSGADYIGPNGFLELWGNPTKVKCSAAARDPAIAARLWEVSEQLTGVRYDALGR